VTAASVDTAGQGTFSLPLPLKIVSREFDAPISVWLPTIPFQHQVDPVPNSRFVQPMGLFESGAVDLATGDQSVAIV
jgi:hypothetical protein